MEVSAISTVLKELIKLLLSQLKAWAKKKEVQEKLETSFKNILTPAENEPFFNDLSKLIETGAFARQLLHYSMNTPRDAKSIKTRSRDIAEACCKGHMNKTQLFGLVHQLSESIFSIVNEPDGSDAKKTINVINEHSAKLHEKLERQTQTQEEILAAVKTPKTTPVTQAPAIPVFINSPFAKNRCFVSRETLLSEIQSAFVNGENTVYLSALGGFGKTQIAREYVYRYEKEYTRILWVNAGTEASVLESYQAFITALSLPLLDATDKSAAIFASVHTWMNTHSNWLFVFDNIESDPSDQAWWPHDYRGQILITTQKADIPMGMKIDVPPFDIDDAIAFFKKRTGRDDRDVAKLTERLGGYPLALEQAAAYIKQNTKTDVLGYLDLLGSEFQVLTIAEGMIAYKKSIFATTQIAMNRINSESAKQLLYLCSYFAPDGIDPILFSKNKDLLPKPLRSSFKTKLSENAVWHSLTNYSLLQSRDGETGYSMHRLLQEVIRNMLASDTQWAQYCLSLFSHAFTFSYGDTTSHTQFLALLPHVEAFLNHASLSLSTNVEQAQLAVLYHEGGWGLFHRGLYSQALVWYHKNLRICEKVLGTEHPATATSYNNIAGVYTRQGQYDKALEWYQKALRIREKVLGTEHPATATSYNNIAGVYARQGQYNKALEWYQKALRIREKVLGTEHPATASSYNNIAGVYARQGQYDKALEWYQKALRICEKVLGTEHPDTATSYNNIAGVYDSQGQYDKALEWYQKALRICEKVLGTEHPDTATSYNNIAGVYTRQGQYDKALEWYHKDLRICEKVLGTEHPDTATSYNNIAYVYARQGEYDRALEWYQKALRIHETVLGTEHPDTATSYNNIAGVYTRQGQYDKALEWEQKAYEVFMKKLGPDHPYTKIAADAICYFKSKQ